MNLAKAHESLDSAVRCLEWFVPNENHEVVRELVAWSKAAESLAKAKADARAAKLAFWHTPLNHGVAPDGGTHDEAQVVLDYLDAALAELDYQQQKAA